MRPIVKNVPTEIDINVRLRQQTGRIQINFSSYRIHSWFVKGNKNTCNDLRDKLVCKGLIVKGRKVFVEEISYCNSVHFAVFRM